MLVWPLLTEGDGAFDPAPLHEAVPRGAAWFAALRPRLFFRQAADRLEAAGSPRAARWSSQLRQPSGQLALVANALSSFALSLDLGDGAGPAALRLRLGCPDLPSAVQVSVLLHAWRARRAAGTDTAAPAFATATVARHGLRNEVTFTGTPEAMARLIVPAPRG